MEIDWDLIRANTTGAFLGKLIKDYGIGVVEKAAEDVLKYRPADWKSYLRSRCKELKKKVAPPKDLPIATMCECGDFSVAPGGRCMTCHEKYLDTRPEYKRAPQIESEEIEAEIRLKAGEPTDYKNIHRYLMALYKCCGERIDDNWKYGPGAKKFLRDRYAQEKQKAENLERIEKAGV